MPAIQSEFKNTASNLLIEVIPAGFQYIEDTPPDIAVNALPIDVPRASAPIFKNWAEVVPVLEIDSVLSSCEYEILDKSKMIKYLFILLSPICQFFLRGHQHQYDTHRSHTLQENCLL